MVNHTITLTQESIHNELKDKLKNLQKFEQSEEFKNIKKYCDVKVSEYEKKIESEVEKRKTKTKEHKAIFSELDLMLFNLMFLEDIQLEIKDKTVLSELKESIEAVKSHIYLQTNNFDFCIYSELDWIKHNYKLYMWFEMTIKQMITKYELQEKEVDVNSSLNAYSDKSNAWQIPEIEV